MEFTLQTARLVIDELQPQDLGVLAEVLGDPESMRYYEAPFTRGQTAAWIERWRRSYGEHGFGLWAVRLRSTGELVGDTGLSLQDVDGEQRLEVGWHIHPDHQRRGYATEAGRSCVDYAFGQLGAEAVISLVRPENVPSARVAQKLGMTVRGSTLRGPGWPHDIWTIDRAGVSA